MVYREESLAAAQRHIGIGETGREAGHEDVTVTVRVRGDRKLGCGCGCGKKRLTSKVELSSTGRAELVKGSEEECLYGSQLR